MTKSDQTPLSATRLLRQEGRCSGRDPANCGLCAPPPAYRSLAAVALVLSVFLAGCTETLGEPHHYEKVDFTETVEVQGHSYLFFHAGLRTFAGRGGVVHDPDCPHPKHQRGSQELYTLRPFQASEQAGMEEQVGDWWFGRRILVVSPDAARADALLAMLRLSPAALIHVSVSWVTEVGFAPLDWEHYALFVVDVGDGPLPSWVQYVRPPTAVYFVNSHVPDQPTVDGWVREVAMQGLATST